MSNRTERERITLLERHLNEQTRRVEVAEARLRMFGGALREIAATHAHNQPITGNEAQKIALRALSVEEGQP